MKPDSVARFDVERAKAYCDSRCDNDMLGIFTAMRDMLDQGTSYIAESKKETIEIDRAVAEEWFENRTCLIKVDDGISVVDHKIYNHIKQALAGRNGG